MNKIKKYPERTFTEEACSGYFSRGFEFMNESNSYSFFSNKECRYFPCHNSDGGKFNCLFCYCPLYALGDRCGGNFEYLPNGVKSCMKCAIPHTEKGYEYVMSKIGEVIRLAEKK